MIEIRYLSREIFDAAIEAPMPKQRYTMMRCFLSYYTRERLVDVLPVAPRVL